MAEIKDFKVGQTVYVRITGNEARGKEKDKLIQEWMVSKVGKKYVYAKPCGKQYGEVCFEKREHGKHGSKFCEKTEHCINYILYSNVKEIQDENEQSELWNKISEVFRGYGINYNISLDQLRRINAILEESEKN